MKKVLIASCAAIACSAAVADDTKITVYGLLDMGYSWTGDNYDGRKSSRSAFDGSQASGSRFGVRGEERLSKDLTAIFTIEGGISPDIGDAAQGGLTWGRQAFVGLTYANVGTVSMGRQYTPIRNFFVGEADPFGLGSVGRMDNTLKGLLHRADNSISFSSEYFGDIVGVDAIYSLRSAGQEATGNEGDERYYNILPKLKFFGGALKVVASYANWKVKDAPEKNEVWDLAGVVTQPAFKISAGYSRYNNYAQKSGDPLLINGEKAKFDRYFVGGKVPVGNLNLLASYVYSKDKNNADYEVQQISVGGKYNLSKRTGLYLIYARLLADNDTGDFGGYALASASGVPGNGYRSGVNIGMTHAF